MRRLSGGLGGLTALSSLAGGSVVRNATSATNNRTRSRLANCGRYCRLTLTFLFSHIGLGALVVGYALIGASVFSMLERPSCIQARMNAIEKREALVTNLLRMTKNLTIIRLEDWKEEARQLLDGYTNYLGEVVKKRGYDGKDEEEQSKWDFLQSLLYSVIVITTIGYGDAVPKTDQGKLATILYAIIGIPLMLVFLSTIGDVMAHAFKFFYWQICCTICFRPRVKRISKKQRRKRKERRRLRNLRRQERAKMAALAALSALHQPQSSPGRTPPPTTPVARNQFSVAPATPPPSASTQPNSTSDTSGSAGHRQAFQPFRFPATSSPLAGSGVGPPLPAPEYLMADVNRVPIVVNQYALQKDKIDQSKTIDLEQQTYESLYADETKTVANRFLDLELQQRLLADMQNKFELCSSESDSDSDFDDREYTNVPIPVCLALIVGYICGGAFLFLEIQQSWKFEESAYFTFVTLSTIGFGDYLLKTEDIAIRDSKGALILCSLYTIFGMALIAMSFNLLKDETTRILKTLAVTIGLVSKQEGNFSYTFTMRLDIKRFDIYRKIPKDLTEPTYSGAIISICCTFTILLLLILEFNAFISPEIVSELFVENVEPLPSSKITEKIKVFLNISLPNLECKYVGLDIQDDMGRHEVGFVDNTKKNELNGGKGCNFEASFQINKVPGNFHVSTHSAERQPDVIDMSHVIHDLTFGEDISETKIKGSFNALKFRSKLDGHSLETHEYHMKIVPTIYEDGSNRRDSFQYTYDLNPITVKYHRSRKPLYSFLTTIAAIVGGVFTVAGIIDSLIFTASNLLKKLELGKLS